MAYRFTMELGEAPLEVNLLAWLELAWAALTVGSGAGGVAVVVERLASLHTGHINGRQKICGSVFITLSITCQFEIVYLKALCPLGKYICCTHHLR